MMVCKSCVHYNGGNGSPYCEYCDPPYFTWYKQVDVITEVNKDIERMLSDEV